MVVLTMFRKSIEHVFVAHRMSYYNIIIICVHTWSKAHTTVYCSVARGSGSIYSGQRHIIFLSRSVWTKWKNKIKSFQLFIRAN